MPGIDFEAAMFFVATKKIIEYRERVAKLNVSGEFEKLSTGVAVHLCPKFQIVESILDDRILSLCHNLTLT